MMSNPEREQANKNVTNNYWDYKDPPSTIYLRFRLTSLSLSSEDSKESHSSLRWTLPDGTSFRLNHCLQKQSSYLTHIFLMWLISLSQDFGRSCRVMWGVHCHMVTGKQPYSNIFLSETKITSNNRIPAAQNWIYNVQRFENTSYYLHHPQLWPS